MACSTGSRRKGYRSPDPPGSASVSYTHLDVYKRQHWNSANIVAKDPVTLGLCSQRELDALVAKAAKKAGIKAPEDGRFEGDRDALLEELRAERTAANEARAAEVAAEVASDEAAS